MRYALVCLLACAGLAHADLVCLPSVNPGAVLANTNDTCPSDSNGTNPVGTLFSDTGVQTFNFVGSGVDTNGTLREVVYKEATGTLDFLVQVSVTGGALGTVQAIDTGDFSGFTTAVGSLGGVSVLGSLGTVEPGLDFRTMDGDTVGWLFTQNPLTAGTTSFTLAISTNATMDKASNIGLIGAGGGTETLLAFQPTVVPEPTFWVMLAGGVIGLIWRQRRPA